MTEPSPPPHASPTPGAFAELCLALGFLTRLPVPLAPTTAALPLATSVRAFAPAGAVVGALGAGLYALVWYAGLPPMLAALMGLAATSWATGALHEDGLADFADASGARDVERRLPFARSDGAAVRAGRPSAAHAAAALGIGAAFLLPLGIFGFAIALLFAGGVTLYTSALARRQLGGQTGDALGMVQQSVEIAILIAALIATVLFEAHAWMD